jgi:hypothetical protein
MNRVARCLKALGCHRFQVRTGDKRVWKYRRPVTEEAQSENVTPDQTGDHQLKRKRQADAV